MIYSSHSLVLFLCFTPCGFIFFHCLDLFFNVSHFLVLYLLFHTLWLWLYCFIGRVIKASSHWSN